MSREAQIAVVGLGVSGLAALKNLREAGFNAVGFDHNNYIGGLWVYNPSADKTSVLQSTVSNGTKQLACYTDFPYPDEVSDFAPAAKVAEYLQSYADHFELMPHCRLNTKVLNIDRINGLWQLTLTNIIHTEPIKELFDRVVVATGIQTNEPKVPSIPGLKGFAGNILHCNAYKSPEPFTNQRVAVIGLGNTGGDIALELSQHASHVHLISRNGNAVADHSDPSGSPADQRLFRMRLIRMASLANKFLPTLVSDLAVLILRRVSRQAMRKASVRAPTKEWFQGVQSPVRKIPCGTIGLLTAVSGGHISLHQGVLACSSGKTLEFENGETLQNVDAVILTTGLRANFSMFAHNVDPCRSTPKAWFDLPGAQGRPFPRLYQGIFSLDFPDSLAVLGYSPFTPQVALNADISSLALAYTWLGKSTLPSQSEMEDHVDAQQKAVMAWAKTGDVLNLNLRNSWEWFRWCDNAAGLGVVKKVEYGLEGWKFWWRDRVFCKVVMDGILSPHIFRIWDEGKRPVWEGAKEEVIRIHKSLEKQRQKKSK